MAKNDLAPLAGFFKLASDKTRLQILALLAEEGELNVNDICVRLQLAQPTVSHHLGLLRMNRVIANQRKGKQVFYSLQSHAKASKGKVRVDLDPFAVLIEGL
jgi:DNA-binding transcriptional ArsR family regulator